MRRELAHEKIREFRKSALHYQLDLKSPEINREIGIGSPGKKSSVRELMVDYLERTPLDLDVNRKELVTLARHHLDDLGADDEVS